MAEFWMLTLSFSVTPSSMTVKWPTDPFLPNCEFGEITDLSLIIFAYRGRDPNSKKLPEYFLNWGLTQGLIYYYVIVLYCCFGYHLADKPDREELHAYYCHEYCHKEERPAA